MKKRVLAYLNYIDELLQQDNVDWEKEIKKHLVQIGFFAHERLVHLIVMVLFSIGTFLTILYVNFTGELIISVLAVFFFILLIPYVMHYYLLENSVQKMYTQYDCMLNKIDNSFCLKDE